MGTPDDVYEREADRVAALVETPAMPGHTTSASPNPNDPASIVALPGPGQPLAPDVRSQFESRFGHSFGDVRLHVDGRAAATARALRARAFTVGSKIAFACGEYAPSSRAGRALIAHELTHVLQQRGGGAARGVRLTGTQGPMLNRNGGPILSGVQEPPTEKQEESSGSLVFDLAKKVYRGTQQWVIAQLRESADRLPGITRPIAHEIIGVIEVLSDLWVSFCMAVIGLVTGFVKGIFELVVGLLFLFGKTLEGLYHLLLGAFDDFAGLKNWWDNLWTAIKDLPTAFRTLFGDWIQEFKTADKDRQTFMIGELVGRIEAILATFYLTAARGGSAARVAVTTEEAAATGGARVISLAARAGAASARRPAPPPAATSLPTRGATALKPSAAPAPAPAPAPVPVPIEPVPVQPIPFPQPVGVPVSTAVTGTGIAKTVATGTAVGTAGAVKASKKKRRRKRKKKRCPEPLPVAWPAGELPVPEFARPFRRQSRGEREWEGIDRNEGNQRRMAEENRRRRESYREAPWASPDDPQYQPVNPCYDDDTDPNAIYNAHHTQPLYLGGGDEVYNLCSVENRRHERGHVRLDDQKEYLDVYRRCGVTSGALKFHPVGQEYFLAKLK